MNYEQEIAQLKANNNRLRLAALNAISFMSGGDAKADLRDAYVETPEESLFEHDAQVIEQFSADLLTITNEMKAQCVGAFSWKEDADYYAENGEIVELVATRTVPWDLCKDIYKKMLSVKLRQKAQGG